MGRLGFKTSEGENRLAVYWGVGGGGGGACRIPNPGAGAGRQVFQVERKA